MTQYVPDYVTPPADTLHEVMQHLDLAPTDYPVLHAVLAGATITPDVAASLAVVTHLPAAFWITRQRQYLEWLARSAVARAGV